MQTLRSLFETLVGIDSISGEEQNVANFIRQYLQELGLDPQTDEHGMIWCRVGSGANPGLLVGHMDTVEPGRGISVIEEDGFLRSAGETILGGDNKVAVAAMLYTISDLLHRGEDPNCELLFTVREETDSGIQQFDTSVLESKVAYVFDQGTTDGSLNVVVKSAPTLFDLTIELHGRSAHAARPETGINVLKGLLSLHEILRLDQYDEKTTLNLGRIEGGSAANTVPAHLTLTGDLRSSDHAHAEYVRDTLIEQITAQLDQRGIQSTCTFAPYSYAYSLDLEHEPSYPRLQRIYQEMGMTLEPVATLGGSDASYLNHQGITAYCLGSGVTGAHTTDEQISITAFETVQKLMERVVME